MVVAFIGASGSGKSTLISKLLELPDFKKKKVFIHREDSFLLLQIAKYIFGKSIFERFNNSRMSGKPLEKHSVFSLLVYFLYPIVVYLEFSVVNIIFKHLLRNTILVCDRYIYDYLITFKNNLKIDNIFTSWLFTSFPKPNLIFFLDISPEVSIGRIKSNSERRLLYKNIFHVNVVKDYRNIAKKKNILKIKTDKEINSAVKLIKNHLENRRTLLDVRAIAICGLDGVGKTTLCKLIASYSEALGVPCKVVHFYHNNILLKLTKNFNLLKSTSADSSFSTELILKNEKKRNRHPLVSFVFALAHFTDSYIQYYYYKFLYKNSLVVFDRYFYDYIVSFEYYNVKQLSFFDRIIPDIKNKYLIVNTPLEAFKRKPEASKDFYFFEHNAYLNIARNKNITMIKSIKKTPNALLKDVLKILKNEVSNS